jgi:hypothetical protein
MAESIFSPRRLDRQALDKMGEEFVAEKRRFGAAASERTAAD